MGKAPASGRISSLRPLLKWAGGKRWLIPHLKPFWEQYSNHRLVEPLCGGLAVTLAFMPHRALLNDINSHLINFYRWVQKGLYIELPLKNEETLYYAYRDRFNYLIKTKRDNTKEAAALFYYLNRTGYNGLCRFNQKGTFNVPFGKYKTINYVRDYLPYRGIFQRWQFNCCDFELLPLDKADFIYADPPYDVQFTHYTKGGFSWEDQVRLAQWLAEHPGPVILSNQATARIVDLYHGLGFGLLFFDAPRMISCSGDRTPAREIMAYKGL